MPTPRMAATVLTRMGSGPSTWAGTQQCGWGWGEVSPLKAITPPIHLSFAATPCRVPAPALLILAKFIQVAPTLWLMSLASSLLHSPRGMDDLGCQKAAREFCRTVLHFDGGGNIPLCTQKSTFLPMNGWNGLKTSKQTEKKQSITTANGN